MIWSCFSHTKGLGEAKQLNKFLPSGGYPLTMSKNTIKIANKIKNAIAKK